MAGHKTVLIRAQVDQAQRAHNCQHNQRHRLERGDRRLKVTKDRSDEHFCVKCATEFLERDIARLEFLLAQLRGEVPVFEEIVIEGTYSSTRRTQGSNV